MNTSSLKSACPHIEERAGPALTLVGSRCADCAEVYFPPCKSCTRCLSLNLEAFDIGERGHLWSWTVQSFRPKEPYNGGEEPEHFQPYGVGYVEMPSGIKIEARLSTADESELHIGMRMKLALAPYGATNREPMLWTFVFEPENEQ
ncbi:MAG TPA: OB-fold domain-containing protein [Burkholderiaceae bacterium]|jgi:uncharacterized OB-fold protein